MKNEETARRLRQAMYERNIRPIDLAEKSGVSKASISQYCNGTYAPSNLSAGKMAEVLKVDPVWLMGFDVPAPFYTDEEVDELAQALADRPELKVLLDASNKLSKEDIEFLLTMVERMNSK